MRAVHVHPPAAGRDARRLLALAALQQDCTGRQLSTLRNTYPAWDVQHVRDASGHVRWIATLREPLTAAMDAAGVLAYVLRPDAIALAAALAWQTALLAGARPHTGPH